MKRVKIGLFVLLVIFLTILTQTGGLILLLCLPVFRLIDKKTDSSLKRRLYKPLLFISVYLISSFTLIPFLAKPFGRVPLPVFSNDQIKPLTIWTCLLNRHYVRPDLKRSLENAAVSMQEKYPETVIAYLDGNFPFINSFPLIPHLSHNDGKKLDLAFFYKDKETGKSINGSAPSFIGYGVCEGPRPGEQDMPGECRKKGYRQYGFLEYLVPQWNKDDMLFDGERTKALILFLIHENSVGKIFIEPHLKERMELDSEKVRFHGCRAVRHDDHIHFQLK